MEQNPAVFVFPGFAPREVSGESDLVWTGGANEWPANFPLLRQFVQKGVARFEGGSLILDVDDVYEEARREDDGVQYLESLLQLPVFEGLTFLDQKGDFSTNQCRFELRFPTSFNGNLAIGLRPVRISGPYLSEGPSLFLTGPALYALRVSVNEANQSWPQWGLPARYGWIKEIQKNAEAANTRLSNFLRRTIVRELGRIVLDVQPAGIGDPTFRLVPRVNDQGNNNGDLSASLDGSPGDRGIHAVDRPDGQDMYIVRPEVQGILQDLKRRKSMTARDLGELIRHPPEEWDDEFLDTEALFSDRVLGYGIFKAKAVPFVTKIENRWVPLIEVGEPGDTEIILDVETVEELQGKLDEAEKSGKDEIEFRNKILAVGEVRSILAAARDVNRNPYQKPAKIPEKVLLAKDNIENKDYEVVPDEAPANTFEYVDVPGLAPGIVLKEHQQIGINWMVGLFRNKVPGALLADDMGLGKTIQVLASMEVIARETPQFVALLLCPVSLIENWRSELQKFFSKSGLTMISPKGEPDTVRMILEHRERFHGHVVVTSYDDFRRHYLTYIKIDWTMVALDEAQAIKTPGRLITNHVKLLKPQFRLALSGTPVENSFVDLWSIVDFVWPGLLGSAAEFAKRFQVSSEDPESSMEAKASSLRKILDDQKILLRRIKDDTLLDLPRKIEHSEDQELHQLMPVGQQELYDLVIASAPRGKGQERKQTLKVIGELKKVSDHPLLLRDQTPRSTTYDQEAAKLLSLRWALDRAKDWNEKVLVFAEFRKTQQILAEVIRKWYGIIPDIINGDTATGADERGRYALVQKLGRQPGFAVLILSPKAAGVGLNITSANHVFHYSRHWNPAKEEQATDRAYRIGATKDVHVYYPISIHSDSRVSTFDQVLNELLSRKKHLKSVALFPTAAFEVSPEEMAGKMGLG